MNDTELKVNEQWVAVLLRIVAYDGPVELLFPRDNYCGMMLLNRSLELRLASLGIAASIKSAGELNESVYSIKFSTPPLESRPSPTLGRVLHAIDRELHTLQLRRCAVIGWFDYDEECWRGWPDQVTLDIADALSPQAMDRHAAKLEALKRRRLDLDNGGAQK